MKETPSSFIEKKVGKDHILCQFVFRRFSPRVLNNRALLGQPFLRVLSRNISFSNLCGVVSDYINSIKVDEKKQDTSQDSSPLSSSQEHSLPSKQSEERTVTEAIKEEEIKYYSCQSETEKEQKLEFSLRNVNLMGQTCGWCDASAYCKGCPLQKIFDE